MHILNVSYLTALEDHTNNEKLLEKKIKILCHQGLFDDAYNLALLWLQRQPRVSYGDWGWSISCLKFDCLWAAY